MKEIKEHVYPVRLVESANADNADCLLKQSTLQIGLSEPTLCRIRKGGYIILDFGEELNGGIRLLAHKGAEKVRIRLGESVGETCAELGQNNATNDHSLRDICLTVPDFSDGTYLMSGFRFARVDVSEGEITLKSAVAVYTHYGEDATGSFTCDDKLLNEIFRISARTVMLNIQNGMLWDGIKRDRLVWIGDIHPETLSSTRLYSDLRFISDSVRYAMETTPLPDWMNNHPTYSMWWLMILDDYYRVTGDKKLLTDCKEYVVGLVKQIGACVEEDGSVRIHYYFLDWPTHEKPDEKPGVAALCKLAMQAGRRLLESLGASVEHADGALAKLKRYTQLAKQSKQAIAMQTLAGMRSDVATLVANGAAGMSTFMSYYILAAAFDGGYREQTLELLREYYGGMLQLGATSFWEDFSVDWLKNAAPITRRARAGEVDVHATYGDYCYKGYRNSFCHGWSSGPVAFLINKVAGFSVLEDGCRKICVKPQLCGLKYLSAQVPTPYGVVKIYADADKIEVSAPPQIEVVR